MLRVQQGNRHGNRHDVTPDLIRSVMENISVTAFAIPKSVNDVTVLVKYDRSLHMNTHTHTAVSQSVQLIPSNHASSKSLRYIPSSDADIRPWFSNVFRALNCCTLPV